MSWDLIKDYDTMRRFAKDAFSSSMVPDNKYRSPGDVLMVMFMGRELGIGPATAIREFNCIHGKWELSAALMLALAIKGGVEVEWVEHSTRSATIKLTRGSKEHVHSFTMEDAKRAEIDRKNMQYRRFPAAMLRARAMSAAVHAFCPDVLGGGAVYVHGEVSGPSPAELRMLKNDSELDLVDLMLERNKSAPRTTTDPGEAASIEFEELCIDTSELIKGCDSLGALDDLGRQIARLPSDVRNMVRDIYVERRQELKDIKNPSPADGTGGGVVDESDEDPGAGEPPCDGGEEQEDV